MLAPSVSAWSHFEVPGIQARGGQAKGRPKTPPLWLLHLLQAPSHD